MLLQIVAGFYPSCSNSFPSQLRPKVSIFKGSLALLKIKLQSLNPCHISVLIGEKLIRDFPLRCNTFGENEK